MNRFRRHYKQFTERRRRVDFYRTSRQSDARQSDNPGPLLSGILEGGESKQALQHAQGGPHETGLTLQHGASDDSGSTGAPALSKE